MNKRVKPGKSEFINVILKIIEEDSNSMQTAEQFLKEEGVNPEKIVSEGLLKIKRKQMEMAVQLTEKEMANLGSAREEATAWVDNLLKEMNFSLPELVNNENLTISFRNVDSLSESDIRNILINHFTLKFMNRQNKDDK